MSILTYCTLFFILYFSSLLLGCTNLLPSTVRIGVSVWFLKVVPMPYFVVLLLCFLSYPVFVTCLVLSFGSFASPVSCFPQPIPVLICLSFTCIVCIQVLCFFSCSLLDYSVCFLLSYTKFDCVCCFALLLSFCHLL